MSEVSATPTAVSHRDEGYLAAGISASATTITVGAIYKYPSGVKTKQGFDSTQGFAEISLGGRTEIISFGAASVNATTKITTLTDVRRGLSQTSTTQSLTAGTGIAFPKGAKIRVIDSANYIQATSFKDKANTFTEDQTIESGNKLLIGGANAYVWTENSGTDLKFKDANNSEKTLSQLAAAGGSDEKVAISANDTTPDYLVNKVTGGDGISVTEVGDGGDESLDIDLDVPVVVAHGGSGRTSHTEYAVICGGTGTTTAQQSIASVGTAGQVLKSNGAGALPTFQDNTALHYRVPVFQSSTTSGTLTNPTSDTAYNTYTYEIPANDLVNGVWYEAKITSEVNYGTSSTFLQRIRLDGTSAIAASVPANTSGGTLVVTYRLFGTAAAGSAVSVKADVVGGIVAGSSFVIASNNPTNFDTNTALTIDFTAFYGTGNGGHNAKIIAGEIWKCSTTPFAA